MYAGISKTLVNIHYKKDINASKYTDPKRILTDVYVILFFHFSEYISEIFIMIFRFEFKGALFSNKSNGFPGYWKAF